MSAAVSALTAKVGMYAEGSEEPGNDFTARRVGLEPTPKLS
jgi:hypothetical protein